jgi:ribosomal protein L11 methyltransferase
VENLLQGVEKAIFKTVCNSHRRLTPADLQNKMTLNYGFSRKHIRKALNVLIDHGDLLYSYQFGCTFIEKSFDSAVRISGRVILKPPNVTFCPSKDDIVVAIQKGVSFGNGAHPTTRLAIKGIEQALSGKEPWPLKKECRAIDIGTGSGVLCITAVRFGITSAVGIDIDPCATSEARQNVSFNNLQNHIMISDAPLSVFTEKFFLIIANLRYPTLKTICPEIAAHAQENGFIVLSGIKNFEVGDLLKTYTDTCFDLLWKFEEKDWSSVVLQKRYR